ncbi:MAG: ferrochelatase [Chloroherpetonaceae bacterium]|nr:ferrochelatase [Chloroherpetonaceae bacterium]MDW8436498.1 ferrochelatase [Chloroherpetonaceae bacterium]
MPKKIAVLLATYGEVEEATFKNLYPNSSRILRLITSRIVNLPKPLQILIATARSLKRKSYWRKLGYRSKLNDVTRRQAKALQEILNQNSSELTYIAREAFYFAPPHFETVLSEVSDCDAIIVAPMIPIESDFACGIACYVLFNEFQDLALRKTRVLKHFWNDDDLTRICVEHVFENLPKNLPEKIGLALTAHGTLVKDNRGEKPKINAGYEETLAFFEKIKSAIERDARNRFASIKLGALNHKFGGEWMPETLGKALEEFKADGISEIAMFPFGFFADNSEADLEGVEEAKAAGFRVHYVPCLNDAEPFIRWLARRIERSAKRFEFAAESVAR